MVNMGMRLEEGVRTGRLTKEGGSSSGTKTFGSGFQKKKEQSVDMVSQGRPRGNVNRLLLLRQSLIQHRIRDLPRNFNNNSLDNRLSSSAIIRIVCKELHSLI